MLFRKLLSFIAVLLILTGFTASSFASHSWNNYHWARTTATFTLQVIDSTTPDWDSELNNSLIEWSKSSVLDLEITSADDSKGIRKRCKMQIGQMRVCNADYGYNGWLGIATIGIDPDGHIGQGTAKVNDSYASYWTIAGEKNHVMCQEIGHVIGLAHTSEDGSSQGTCMDYSSSLDSQWPNQHDYDQLAAIYAHLDSFDSYDNGSDGGDGDDGGGGNGCNAPPGKGCNKNNANAGGDIPPMGIRVHRGKGHEIWAAPRKDGGLWIHHVRLVPEGY